MDAFHVAIQFHHLDIIRYIVEKVQVDADLAIESNATPLMIAYDVGHLDVIRYLVPMAAPMSPPLELTDGRHSTSPRTWTDWTLSNSL